MKNRCCCYAFQSGIHISATLFRILVIAGHKLTIHEVCLLQKNDLDVMMCQWSKRGALTIIRHSRKTGIDAGISALDRWAPGVFRMRTEQLFCGRFSPSLESCGFLQSRKRIMAHESGLPDRAAAAPGLDTGGSRHTSSPTFRHAQVRRILRTGQLPDADTTILLSLPDSWSTLE